MLQQARELSSHDGMRAFGLALAAAALLALAGTGGYAIGSVARPAAPVVSTQPVAAPQDAPPVIGFQP